MVADPVRVKHVGLRAELAVAITGTMRRDDRAPGGIEFDADEFTVLNQSADNLPFTSVSRLDQLSPELVINYRPLALHRSRRGDLPHRSGIGRGFPGHAEKAQIH